MKKILLFFLVLGLAGPCFAKAYFAPKKEMIRNADCIVIVEITKVEALKQKGEHWTFGQKATATVKRCLKGSVKGEIEIRGMESFKCAQCRYEKGRFLLFLSKGKGFWTGSNWQLGIRPITKDKVQWFKDDKARREMKATPLADVIAEIEKVMKKGKRAAEDKAK
jgi:hypothetical protein